MRSHFGFKLRGCTASGAPAGASQGSPRRGSLSSAMLTQGLASALHGRETDRSNSPPRQNAAGPVGASGVVGPWDPCPSISIRFPNLDGVVLQELVHKTYAVPGKHSRAYSWYTDDACTVQRFRRSRPNKSESRDNAQTIETYAVLQEKQGMMHFKAAIPVGQLCTDGGIVDLHAGATRAATFYKAHQRSPGNPMIKSTLARGFMMMEIDMRSPEDVQVYFCSTG